MPAERREGIKRKEKPYLFEIANWTIDRIRQVRETFNNRPIDLVELMKKDDVVYHQLLTFYSRTKEADLPVEELKVEELLKIIEKSLKR